MYSCDDGRYDCFIPVASIAALVLSIAATLSFGAPRQQLPLNGSFAINSFDSLDGWS